MDQEAHIPLTQDSTSLLELTTGRGTGDPALEDGRDLRGGCTRQVQLESYHDVCLGARESRLTRLGGSIRPGSGDGGTTGNGSSGLYDRR